MTPVEVSVSPALREDHQIQLLVNGELSQSLCIAMPFGWQACPGAASFAGRAAGQPGRIQHRTDQVTIFIAD